MDVSEGDVWSSTNSAERMNKATSFVGALATVMSIESEVEAAPPELDWHVKSVEVVESPDSNDPSARVAIGRFPRVAESGLFP